MKAAALLILVVAAAACSKAPEPKAEDALSERDVAAEATKLKLEPGRWETTTLITDIDVSGLPADATDAATGTPTTTATCVTPAQAAKPDASFLSGTRDANCEYQRFSMAGKRIDAALTCSPRGLAGGKAIEMKLTGGYSSTAFAMNMTMNTKLAASMAMTMKATVNGKRTGACTGDEGSAS